MGKTKITDALEIFEEYRSGYAYGEIELERLDEKRLQSELEKVVGVTLLAEVTETQQKVALQTLIEKIRNPLEGTEFIRNVQIEPWAKALSRFT